MLTSGEPDRAATLVPVTPAGPGTVREDFAWLRGDLFRTAFADEVAISSPAGARSSPAPAPATSWALPIRCALIPAVPVLAAAPLAVNGAVKAVPATSAKTPAHVLVEVAIPSSQDGSVPPARTVPHVPARVTKNRQHHPAQARKPFKRRWSLGETQ